MKGPLKDIKSKTLSAVYRGKSRVDLDMLLSEVMEKFGGVSALANELYSAYRTPGASVHTKHKILETIQRLIHASTVLSQHNRLKVSDLSDEELDDALLDLTQEARDRNDLSTRQASDRGTDSEGSSGQDQGFRETPGL